MKISLSVSLFIVAATSAFASTKQDLQIIYDKFNSAMMARDIKAWDRLCDTYYDKDYVSVYLGTPHDRPYLRKQLVTFFGHVTRYKSQKTTLEKISESGPSVEASLRINIEFNALGPDRKTHLFKGEERLIHSWVHEKRGWILRKSKSLTMRATVDGKAFGGSR